MKKLTIIIIIVAVVIILVGASFATITLLPEKKSSSTPVTSPVTFTIGVTQGIAHIDPAIAYDFTSDAAVLNMYDHLFSVANISGQITVVPSVVTGYNLSTNGTVYTMNIRQGILFHDNTTLTAYDVAFSFNRMLKIDQGITYVWAGILTSGNVTAINNSTVVIHLLVPSSSFISQLVEVYVVNEKLVMSHLASGTYGSYGDYGMGWLATHDAGSGPYKLGAYDPATGITLNKFANYWKGWTSNQITTVDMETMTEEAGVYAAMKSDSIDMTDYTLLPQTYNELAQTPGITVQTNPGLNLQHIEMNCMKAPTNNTYVRQAISYAFDYSTALSQILPGSVQAQGPVVNILPGHNPNVQTYNFNLTKAKELLKESGYTPAQLASFTMTIVYVNSLEYEALLAGLLQVDLAQIGLNVQTVPLTWLSMVSLTANYTTEPNFFVCSSTAAWLSASYYLTRYEMTATGYTAAFFYKNQTLSNMILKALSSTNKTQTNQLYYQIQQDIAVAAPCIWIANAPHQIAYWNYVHGYQFYGLLGFDLYFWNLHIEKAKSSVVISNNNIEQNYLIMANSKI